MSILRMKRTERSVPESWKSQHIFLEQLFQLISCAMYSSVHMRPMHDLCAQCFRAPQNYALFSNAQMAAEQACAVLSNTQVAPEQVCAMFSCARVAAEDTYAVFSSTQVAA